MRLWGKNRISKKISDVCGKFKIIVFLLLLTCCTLYGTACDFNKKEKTSSQGYSKTSFAFNTTITITLYDSNQEELINQCFAKCREFENILSRTQEGSEVYEINKKLKITNHETETFMVSDTVKELIEICSSYSGISEGRFDCTIEPVSSLWDFTEEGKKIPEQAGLEEGISHVDYRKCKLHGNELTMEKGMGLDFGAIAKGYIADCLKEYLQEQGVENGIISLGGNILCIGNRPDGGAYQIGIQMPFAERNETIAAIFAKDCSVVSSGIYERYFTIDDKIYHHILNADTGYPIENNLLGVTIVSPHSVDGDALSTTCFALGLEEGIKYLDSLPDVFGMFITEDGEMHYSEGFTDLLIKE